MRASVAGAFPNDGEQFALGGATLFRGFDLAERQGSFLWVATSNGGCIVRRVNWDVADHVPGCATVAGAVL